MLWRHYSWDKQDVNKISRFLLSCAHLLFFDVICNFHYYELLLAILFNIFSNM